MDPRAPLFMYRLQHSPDKADKLIRQTLGEKAPARITKDNRAQLLDRVFGTSRYVKTKIMLPVGKVVVRGARLRGQPAVVAPTEEFAMTRLADMERAPSPDFAVTPLREEDQRSQKAKTAESLEAVAVAVTGALPLGDFARKTMPERAKKHINVAIRLINDKVRKAKGRTPRRDAKLALALGNTPYNQAETRDAIDDAIDVVEESGLRGLEEVLAELRKARRSA